LKENQDNQYFCPFDYNMLNHEDDESIKKVLSPAEILLKFFRFFGDSFDYYSCQTKAIDIS
jgi:hypothetical protein